MEKPLFQTGRRARWRMRIKSEKRTGQSLFLDFHRELALLDTLYADDRARIEEKRDLSTIDDQRKTGEQVEGGVCTLSKTRKSRRAF